MSWLVLRKLLFSLVSDNYNIHLKTLGTLANSCLSLPVSRNTLKLKRSPSGKPAPALIVTASGNVLPSDDEEQKKVVTPD